MTPTLIKAVLPMGSIVGGVVALLFAFSKPIAFLPRWVKRAYVLLAAAMIVWGIVAYIAAFGRSSLSEYAYALVVYARTWLSGFSLAILIVLMLAGVFPKIFSSSRK